MTLSNTKHFCCLLVFLLLAHAQAAQSDTTPAKGPLRVHPQNPRYFTDGTKISGGSVRAIYLTGSHHWNNLQDSARLGGPLTNRFDYDGYPKRLQGWNHNFTRLWAWEGPVYGSLLTELKSHAPKVKWIPTK